MFGLASLDKIVDFQDRTHLAQTLPNYSLVATWAYYLFQFCLVNPKSPSQYLFVSVLSLITDSMIK